MALLNISHHPDPAVRIRAGGTTWTSICLRPRPPFPWQAAHGDCSQKSISSSSSHWLSSIWKLNHFQRFLVSSHPHRVGFTTKIELQWMHFFTVKVDGFFANLELNYGAPAVSQLWRPVYLAGWGMVWLGKHKGHEWTKLPAKYRYFGLTGWNAFRVPMVALLWGSPSMSPMEGRPFSHIEPGA